MKSLNTQRAKSQLEALTILVVLVEAVGGFFAGVLFLQQRQEPLLLLAAAVHEIVPWLKEQQWKILKTPSQILDPRQILERVISLDGHHTLQSEVTYLDVVCIAASLREDSWDGWITAHFQIIFGALIPLKEISKMASWFLEKGM